MNHSVRLPRNTTLQAETVLDGEVARVLHQATGVIIVVFVLVHVLAQAVLHVPALVSVKADMPWLPTVQKQHWIHAPLYFSVVFHALYGLKLLMVELGANLSYRASLWVIVGISAIVGMREILRYAGI